MSKEKRIFLSPPHMGGMEKKFVEETFQSNWIAPIGPQIDAFETEFAENVGVNYAVALSSGTAALHLALRYAGVTEGDEVFCSSFTFIASAAPILYLNAVPVFIDSDKDSWNMDPQLLAKSFAERAACDRLPKAIVVVHLYGQSAKIFDILELCNRYGVVVVEDAAEALGATYRGKAPGTFGQSGIYSFNGNKIITTSGGGMLVSNDKRLVEKVRFWATQAKEATVHYEHLEIGYNYRMSNVLAAIGRGQLRVLAERVKRKRQIFARYQKALEHYPGLEFMPEMIDCECTRWLSCITIEADSFGVDRDTVVKSMEEANIEVRPLWKPMHLQPLFFGYEKVGGQIAEGLFADGLCLPSGTAMTDKEFERIVTVFDRLHR